MTTRPPGETPTLDAGSPPADEDVEGGGAPAVTPPAPLRALLVVSVLALAVRLLWWWIAHPGPVSDFLGYRSLAGRLAHDGTYTRDGVSTAYRTPGYPGFLGLGILVADSDRWLSLMNVLVSASVAPLTGLVGHRLGFSRQQVVAAAVAAAVMPPLVLWAPVLGSENLQIPLLLGACAVSLARPGSRATIAGAGALFGLSILVRPESLLYLAALPVLLWAVGTEPRRALGRTVLIGLVAAATVSPWYIRNEVVVGRGVGLSSTGGYNFYLAHRPQGYGFAEADGTPLEGLSEVEMTRTGYRLGFEHLRDEPSALIGDAARGTVELYRPPYYAAYYSTRQRTPGGGPFPLSVVPAVHRAARTYAWGWCLFGGLAAVGLVRLRRQPRLVAAIGAFVAANWLCFAVVFWALPRYRLSIEPFLCLAVGAAVARATGPPPLARSR